MSFDRVWEKLKRNDDLMDGGRGKLEREERWGEVTGEM